jgi:hypothetical protein
MKKKKTLWTQKVFISKSNGLLLYIFFFDQSRTIIIIIIGVVDVRYPEQIHGTRGKVGRGEK